MNPSSSSSSSSQFLHIYLRKLAISTVSLPFFAFIFCVLISYWKDFKSSTYTHCEVNNFAPSISASIGTTPQKYLWQFCIALHSAPRFLFSALNANHLLSRLNSTSLSNRSRFVIRFSVVIQWVENVCLLALSIVTSSENFTIHKIAFVSFGLCALVYMCITVYFVRSVHYQAHNQYESYAVKLKKICLKIFFVCSVLMGFFYWRHNTYCEPYVYSLFCISEYGLVLTNMAFHMTAYYDFYPSHVSVSTLTGYQPLNSVDIK